MATMSHEPTTRVGRERPSSWAQLPSEIWGALAISVIWLAVLFDAVFGPDIVNTTSGGNSSTVPSAVVVSAFAFLSTWVVAKYAFARGRAD